MFCFALSSSYKIVQKYDRSRPFSMEDVKNGAKTSVPIVFDRKPAAKYMKEALNVAITINGTWNDAIEMRDNGDLVVSDFIKENMKDFSNVFDYVEIVEVLK